MSEPEKLERGLGLVEATSLNMTFMVGIGPFIVIPFVIQAMHGPASLLAWAAGAALALLDGCIWAELGAAMPQAGGSYVFLREAYGRARWGHLLSFLFIWQTVFQGPLSIASGALGFAQYSGFLATRWNWLTAVERPLGPYAEHVIAAAIIVLVVVLLYRRIAEIGRISIVFSAIVIGTIVWIIWGGAGHFLAPGGLHRVFDFSGADRAFSWVLLAGLGHGMVQTVYSYLGYYNVCNLGGEMKDPERNIPRAIFISILGITVLYLAMQVSILSVISVARSGEFEIHREHVHRAGLRRPVGGAGHQPDSGDGAGLGVFGDAGLLARAVRRRARRQLLLRLRARASQEAFSAHFAGGAGGGGHGLQPALQPDFRDSGHPGDALHHPIRRPGGGADAAAAALGERAAALPDVALSAAGGAGHRRLGGNFHCHGTDADAGIAGSGGSGSSCIFRTRADRAPMAV